MTKERPIIFTGDEVRAILEGRKTQTRRVVKWVTLDQYMAVMHPQHGHEYIEIRECESAHDGAIRIDCPYGVPGDQLYVRETWADVNTSEGPAIAYKADGSYQSWHDFSKVFDKDYGAGPSMDYKAYPGEYSMWVDDLLNGEPDHNWRPSIHMPRWASRINLRIKDIRVERVQDISIEDIKAEGVNGNTVVGYTGGFMSLWNSINAKRGYGWEANPFVWVIEFEKK